jgi:hypothetical protein
LLYVEQNGSRRTSPKKYKQRKNDRKINEKEKEMKNITRFLTIASVALFVPMMVMAQTTSTATSGATAQILAPITVTAGADLDFGDIVPANAGDTVITVLTTGAGSATVANTLIAGTTAAGTAAVGGEANHAFTVVTAADTITNGTDTLNFTTTSNCAAGCVLDGTGAFALLVGGDLTVPDTASAGTYTGTYGITVSYN